MEEIQDMNFDGFESEKDLVNAVLTRLAPVFEIYPEVTGTHCGGGRKRVDAILRPKGIGWFGESIPHFAIEFKRDREGGNKHAAQAWDYTHCEWKGFGRCWLFLCPMPRLAGDIMGLLSRVHVGTFDNDSAHIGRLRDERTVDRGRGGPGLGFYTHPREETPLWHERSGVDFGKRMDLNVRKQRT